LDNFSLGDFFRQVPLQILLAPIVLGALYVGLMSFIIGRARSRRRAQVRQSARSGGPAQRAVQSPLPRSGSAGRITPPQGTVTAVTDDNALEPLDALPEPDLELLVLPGATDQALLADSSGTFAAGAAAAPRSVPTTNVPVVSEEEQTLVPAIRQGILPEGVDIMASSSVQGGEDRTAVQLPEDAIEVLRVYRDLSDGRLIVQIGDRYFRHSGDVRQPELLRRIATIIRDMMVQFVGSQSGLSASASGAAPLPTAETSAAGPLPIEPPAEVLKGGFRKLAGSVVQSASQGTPGIATAIEDFLQYKLINTPQLSTRSIHIRTTPDHGVRIEVDGHYYDAISDIVDADVREFLAVTMREWEARH
jgi:hypothetical protein